VQGCGKAPRVQHCHPAFWLKTRIIDAAACQHHQPRADYHFPFLLFAVVETTIVLQNPEEGRGSRHAFHPTVLSEADLTRALPAQSGHTSQRRTGTLCALGVRWDSRPDHPAAPDHLVSAAQTETAPSSSLHLTRPWHKRMQTAAGTSQIAEVLCCLCLRPHDCTYLETRSQNTPL